MKKIASVLILSLYVACSESDSVKEDVLASNGIALSGYDVVAYFEDSEARQGSDSTTTEHNGFTYYFSNVEYKKLFDKNPNQYLPAYGGWCAYAVATNSIKMESDPTMWKIQDDRLLLFYDDWTTFFTGKLIDEWNQTPINYEEKADANWNNMTN